jgi:hypothetical protein
MPHEHGLDLDRINAMCNFVCLISFIFCVFFCNNKIKKKQNKKKLNDKKISLVLFNNIDLYLKKI